MLRALVKVCLALTELLSAGHAAFAEKRVALVIGNSNYLLAPLTNPANDADDITAALQRLQFEVTERKDLSVRDFDETLDKFIPLAKGADVALFFFSGHGLQIDKRGYLAPVDVKVETESSALRELVAIQEVVSRVEKAARVSVIVLDACRDSPLQERLRRIAIEKNREVIPPKGLPPMSVVGSNTLIVYATVPGETASDGQGRNSPFTASLLKRVETPGLEIELLFKRVTADVLSSTGGKQQPERLSRLQHELMLLPQVPSAAATTPPNAPLSEAAQAWSVVQNSASEGVLEEFIRRFPESVYAGFAKARVEELRRTRTASEGSSSSSWWPWPSGQRPEAHKPNETQQTAIAAPPKPAPVLPPKDACEDGLLVSVAAGKKPCIKPGSGESFKDCPDCPEMVIVPSGSFTMGSPASEPQRSSDEGPQRRVTFAKPFAVGKFAVTFSEWDACVVDGGCGGYKPGDEGWGRGDRPVINVNWNDTIGFAAWLSKKTGRNYRLLSEAEREYAARAGTTTPFWWGSSITPEQANYDGSAEPYEGGGSKGEYGRKTVPVKSFKPNSWGLYQVHGNVWEWAEDCYHGTYNGAPADGSAWTTGECTSHVLRGGSWDDNPQNLRSAFRSNDPDSRYDGIGFRVARTLNP